MSSNNKNNSHTTSGQQQSEDPDPANRSTPSLRAIEMPVVSPTPEAARRYVAVGPAPVPTAFGPQPQPAFAAPPPASNPQTSVATAVFSAPQQPAQPFNSALPPIIRAMIPNLQTVAKIASLARYAHPLFNTYTINPRFTAIFIPIAYPMSPHRPQILFPNHLVFVYFGRDLSSPNLPLPVES